MDSIVNKKHIKMLLEYIDHQVDIRKRTESRQRGLIKVSQSNPVLWFIGK